MTKNGEKVEVVIDDHIPCTAHRQVAFSHSSTHDLWLVLLEKAWAKLHGSYDRIVGGHCHHILRDFTGAPSWQFKIKDSGSGQKPDADPYFMQTSK